MMDRRRLAWLLVVLAGCAGASPPPTNSSHCPKPCVCKWKSGKESVTCHQAGWAEIPAAGLDTAVQVMNLASLRAARSPAQVASLIALTETPEWKSEAHEGDSFSTIGLDS